MDDRYYDPKSVRAARLARGMTQTQVAQDLSVHLATIKRAENGQVSYPLLCLLATFYRVPVSRFLLRMPKIHKNLAAQLKRRQVA
jgi:transcriptional regulator with XRE-family HTH domain